MAEETTKISLRLPTDYVMWLQREIDAKRERGLRSNVTDEILTCIVHRMISKMPPDKRKNLAAAMDGRAPDKKSEEQGELMPTAE